MNTNSIISSNSNNNRVEMPLPVPCQLPSAPTKPLSEHQIQMLVKQGFTRSFAESLADTVDAFALRIWVIDNSGSMQAADGHKIVRGGDPSNIKTVPCTRWAEISECVEYHIRLAELLEAPTRFRYLNHPGFKAGSQFFSLSEPGKAANCTASVAITNLHNAKASGCTPLTAHIYEIYDQVSQMAPELRATGRRVAVIIATDGLPTDERGYGGKVFQQDFVESLRRLEGLPIWLVIRLCTDEDETVEFYNDLDDQLELSIDVLDDFHAEAAEVYEANGWLNYTLALHRLREFGYHDRLFDLIDQTPLTHTQIREFAALLFGSGNFDGVPDPAVDWEGFMKTVTRLLSKESLQYNPVKEKAKPLVSVKRLNRTYRPNTGLFGFGRRQALQ